MVSVNMATSTQETREKSTQTYAAVGVGFVCLIIGLPLWWKTTEVYRVQLPNSEISQLSATDIAYRVDFTVILYDASVKEEDLLSFGKDMQNVFNLEGKENTDALNVKYKFNLRRAFKEEKDLLASSKTVEEFDRKLFLQKVNHECGKYTIVLLPKASLVGDKSALIGAKRTAYVSMEKDLNSLVSTITHVVKELYVNEAAMEKTVHSALGAKHLKSDKETMRTLRTTPGYEITFTLLNPQPDILNARWNIKKAVQDYLNAYIKAFSPYADITVKSQYLYQTGIGVKPKSQENGSYFALNYDDLPHIINPIESFLGSHVSVNPNLNFIVYIPTRDQSPLRILNEKGEKSESNAFLSPRWGGIHVYNVPSLKGEPLPLKLDLDMKSIMEIFLSQFRLLMGVNMQHAQSGIVISQISNEGINDWELDQWLRSKALENIATSTYTLQSLLALLEKVNNIVINDDIGKEVHKSVSAINKAKDFLQKGDTRNGFLLSRDAVVSSEKAFFDPSLLELLYFPEDQKFAIYIPLFLPISVPVLSSLFQAVKYFRNKKKTAEKVE